MRIRKTKSRILANGPTLFMSSHVTIFECETCGAESANRTEIMTCERAHVLARQLDCRHEWIREAREDDYGELWLKRSCWMCDKQQYRNFEGEWM